MQSTVIPLESIQIATPCHADWNVMQRMQGADCIRFCQSCGKNVYDLSGFTRDGAMHLIEAKEGNLCLRLHRRSDGTVITSDCPVGKANAHRHKYNNQILVALSGIGAALLGAGCLLLSRWHVPAHKATASSKHLVEFSRPKKREESLPFKRWPEVMTPLIERPPSETPPPVQDGAVTVDMGAPPPPDYFATPAPPEK